MVNQISGPTFAIRRVSGCAIHTNPSGMSAPIRYCVATCTMRMKNTPSNARNRIDSTSIEIIALPTSLAASPELARSASDV